MVKVDPSRCPPKTASEPEAMPMVHELQHTQYVRANPDKFKTAGDVFAYLREHAGDNNIDEVVILADDGRLVVAYADNMSELYKGQKYDSQLRKGERYNKDGIEGTVLEVFGEYDLDKILTRAVGHTVGLALDVGTIAIVAQTGAWMAFLVPVPPMTAVYIGPVVHVVVEGFVAGLERNDSALRAIGERIPVAPTDPTRGLTPK